MGSFQFSGVKLQDERADRGRDGEADAPVVGAGAQSHHSENASSRYAASRFGSAGWLEQ